jgi:hypothetical protein
MRLGGVDALMRTIRVTLPGQPGYVTREVDCIRKDRVYSLTLACAPADIGRRGSEFDRVLSSFGWLQQGGPTGAGMAPPRQSGARRAGAG